jgi:hypothetical protein
VDLVVDLRLGQIGWKDRMEDWMNEKIAWLVWDGFSWVMMHRTLVVFKMLTHDVFISVYL